MTRFENSVLPWFGLRDRSRAGSQLDNAVNGGPNRVISTVRRPQTGLVGGRPLTAEDVTQLVRHRVRVPVESRLKVAALGRVE